MKWNKFYLDHLFNLLFNGWYYSFYSPKWIGHFGEVDFQYILKKIINQINTNDKFTTILK